MTDKELLERAAKAAGLEGECYLLLGDCSDPAEPGGFRYAHPEGGHDWWNPLMDDGDAFRLACRLGIDIMHFHAEVAAKQYLHNEAVSPSTERLVDNREREEATRRAIVRAAAELSV